MLEGTFDRTTIATGLGSIPVVTVDFGEMETRMLHAELNPLTTGRIKHMRDMNTHLAEVTGMERREIKALRFSEVYGMQRGDFVEQYGERGVQMMTMNFLRNFPVVAGYARLKKSRARMLVECLKVSHVIKGNLEVRNDAHDDGNWYTFRYRGTDIIRWNPFAASEDSEFQDINTGIYEDTPSTRYQRKMVREAVEEFKKVALCL